MLTDENVRELDIPVQNRQRGHVDERLQDLLEKPPRLVLRDALIDPLQIIIIKTPETAQRNGTHLLQRLSLHELLHTHVGMRTRT